MKTPFGLPASWLLFFLLLSVAGAGWRPLWDPDEGRYAEVAREMYVSGDWLTPTLEGAPHLTKPPLTYWLTTLGYHVFGVNEWGARFFVGLAFFLTILCVIELARTWEWNEDRARAAGLVFATALLPFACGHVLTTDMILTFFETLGVLCAWKVWSGAARGGLWRLGFWASFGLAFLTKGPPGWLPLPAVLLYPYLAGESRPRGRLRSAAGMLLLLVLGFGWFAAIIGTDPGHARYFIVDEFYNRIFTTEHDRDNPWWTHILAIAAGLFPWVFLWPELLRRTGRSVRSGWATLPGIERFSLLWFSIALAALLMAQSRMTLYVAPLFVLLSLWAGKILADEYLARIPPAFEGRRAILVSAGVWTLLLLAASFYPGSFPWSKTEKGLAKAVRRAQGSDAAAARYYMLNGSTLHSAAFYLGATIEPLEVEYRDLADVDLRLSAADEHAVYLIKDSRFRRLMRHGVPVRVLGAGGNAVAFELRPSDAALAERSGAPGPDEERVAPEYALGPPAGSGRSGG